MLVEMLQTWVYLTVVELSWEGLWVCIPMFDSMEASVELGCALS